MERIPANDTAQMAATRQRILETGFRLFSQRTIDKVSMQDVADEAGIGVATLYRYYNTKPLLVLAIGTWVWESYASETAGSLPTQERTAAEDFAAFLEAFLDLYRNHKDILRFNQFFNVYVQSEDIEAEHFAPYRGMIGAMEQRFRKTWAKGERDGTLRTDLSPEEIFSAVLHLMLAAVTRYAVGLVYLEGPDPEKELLLLKELFLRRFAVSGEPQDTG